LVHAKIRLERSMEAKRKGASSTTSSGSGGSGGLGLESKREPSARSPHAQILSFQQQQQQQQQQLLQDEPVEDFSLADVMKPFYFCSLPGGGDLLALSASLCMC
jgi:hypothetical protein